MPIEEVRVIANGAVVASFDATTKPKVRADRTTSRARGGRAASEGPEHDGGIDTYYVVEAGPKLPAELNTLPTPPPIVDIVEPDFVPSRSPTRSSSTVTATASSIRQGSRS